MASHRKNSKVSFAEIRNPGYNSGKPSVKTAAKTTKPNVAKKSNSPIELMVDISNTDDGENILAQITPHLLAKTNNQNKKGELVLIELRFAQ